ncbi:hypothetical protein TNCV_3053621 [Trichonephila clavipes]|uniref:Alpha-latrotoxin n=1 Tax=Trichonephila clavipes TaxID=2585209 RepID=A0A8X6S095_TRICX|nr:hypothetical protein TNCV_3053621 [Trichonephila clavipes]
MRAKMGIMMGYAQRTKGYRIWLIDENKLVETINEDSMKIRGELILDKNGAGIESHDNAHFTPLLIAVAEGHVEAIKTLLKFEADINVLDNMDRTVIFWAAQEDHPVSLMMQLD